MAVLVRLWVERTDVDVSAAQSRAAPTLLWIHRKCCVPRRVMSVLQCIKKQEWCKSVTWKSDCSTTTEPSETHGRLGDIAEVFEVQLTWTVTGPLRKREGRKRRNVREL